MENPNFSPTTLVCTESESILNDQLQETEDNDEDDHDDDHEGYIQMLIDRETESAINGGFEKLYLSHIINEKWIQEARLDAIEYILETGKLLGFRIQTMYLSITYLDRFLSRKSINGEKYWALKLLSIACISLAAKMEECRVPTLSQYPMKDLTFESNLIQRMELLVLNTLDWRLWFITPFAFTHYFLSKITTLSHNKSATISRIMDIFLCVIRDAKLMSQRPSVLAAAATLLALNEGLIKESMEFKINALPSGGSLKIDDVLYCYNQMRELEMGKNKQSSKRKRSQVEGL